MLLFFKCMYVNVCVPKLCDESWMLVDEHAFAKKTHFTNLYSWTECV